MLFTYLHVHRVTYKLLERVTDGEGLHLSEIFEVIFLTYDKQYLTEKKTTYNRGRFSDLQTVW